MRFRHYSVIFALAFIGGAIGDLLGHQLLSSQGFPDLFRPKYLSVGKGLIVIDTQGRTWVELRQDYLTISSGNGRYLSLRPDRLCLANSEASSSVTLSPSPPCLLCLRQFPRQEAREVTFFITTIDRCDSCWRLSPPGHIQTGLRQR